LAEINLFLIFLGSIGFDLLIGDPRFFIHPVQIIGFYIKKISDYLINNFGENKRILFWGGFLVAISTIGISFSLGKLIELNYMQIRNNFFSGLLIFFGLSSLLPPINLKFVFISIQIIEYFQATFVRIFHQFYQISQDEFDRLINCHFHLMLLIFQNHN